VASDGAGTISHVPIANGSPEERTKHAQLIATNLIKEIQVMKASFPLQRIKHHDRYLTRAIVAWCTISSGFAASSCRMGGTDADGASSATMQEVKLVGRYNLETAGPSNGSYKQIWFSRDGKYEGLRSDCAPGECLERGEFAQLPNAVTLSGPKGVTTLEVRATVAVAESGGGRGEALALGAVRPTASDAPAPSEDCDWNYTETSETPGIGYVRTASMGQTSADEGLLAGGTSCLLAPGVIPPDVIKNWHGSAPDGETFTAQLAGTQPISKSTPAEPRGKGQCSFMNFCRSYTCYECSTSDTGGCKAARNDNCDYLCPSHRESRCVGPMTFLLMERCGQADGCQ